MRSRLRDVGLTLLLAVFLFIPISAAIILSPQAAAEPQISRTAIQYAQTHAGTVCNILDIDPTVETVEQLVIVAVRDGLTAYQAGEAIGLSVLSVCPEYGFLLDAYVAKWSARPLPYQAGARIGGRIS